MNKKLLRSGFIMVIIIMLCYFANSATGGDKRKSTTKLMDYEVDVYDVLIAGAEGSPENQKRKDVLRDCPAVLKELRFGNNVSEENLDLLTSYMDEYYEYGYLPREPYESVPGGEYVTSMDAPLLAVCCELAFERTNDEIFHQYVCDLIPYLVADTTGGGYVLKENKDCWWPLEYAWSSVTPQDAWYVINGSLYGTLCTQLIYECTGDLRLEKALEKFINAYESHANEFYYENDMWTWYSLNSVNSTPIIDLSEKLFIEVRALKALYILTNNSFFKEEYEHRMRIWSKLYPIYLVEKNGHDFVSFLRAGAPHPYQVDIYPTSIEIYDEKWKLLKTINSPNRTVENAYLVEEVPGRSKYYKLYAKINSIEDTLLVEGELKKYERRASEKVIVSDCITWGDTVSYNNGFLNIDKSADELEKAVVQFELNKKYDNMQETYWIIDLDNVSKEVYGVQIVLEDEDGNSVSRYLQQVKEGHNSLLFSLLGFQNATSIKNVKKIRLDLITNSMDNDEGSVRINDIFYCSSTVEVVDYLTMTEGYIDYWYSE